MAWKKKRVSGKACKPDLITTVPAKLVGKKSDKTKPRSKTKSGKGATDAGKTAAADDENEAEEVRQAVKAVADAEAADNEEGRTPVMDRLNKKLRTAEEGEPAEIRDAAIVEELKRRLQEKKKEMAKS